MAVSTINQWPMMLFVKFQDLSIGFYLYDLRMMLYFLIEVISEYFMQFAGQLFILSILHNAAHAGSGT